jgi:hypothetical protein
MKTINLVLIVSLFSCNKTTYKQASLLVEDNCSLIEPLSINLNSDSVWELKNNEAHLYYFPNKEEARNTLNILEHYQTTQLCQCGEGYYTDNQGEENPSNNMMQYQLTEDYTGIGNNELNSYENSVEDCLPFNPEKLVARKSLDGNWYLIERPGHSMFGFGKDEDACKDALSVIKKYEFNQSCFLGRANASFNYLKRYREDIDTLRSFN